MRSPYLAGLTWSRGAFLVILLIFFMLFLVYPLANVLVNAFYVDGQFTLAFFKLMLTDAYQWSIVLNSVNLAILVTLATSLLAIPIALLITRNDFPGKNFLQGLLLVPMILPPFVGAVGMRQMFARFGSINLFLMETGLMDRPIDWFGGGALLGVVVLQVLHLFPIMYLNVAAALANVDPGIEEAARNVGANGFTLFRKITFPLMLPGFFAGASIVFIWSFTDLGTPLMFEYRQLVPVQIFDMINDIHENPMGYILVVLMILLTVGFFILTKSILGGRQYEMMSHGQIGQKPRKASRSRTSFIYLIIFGITFFALIPHVSVVLTSFAERWFMSVLPQSYTTRFYGMIFEHRLTSVGMSNSLLLSSISTIIDVVVGIAIAYLLVRTRIPGKTLLDSLTMLPLAIPGIIIAFGYLSGFSGTFLDARVNPIPLLIIAYAIRRMPYMVRSAYAGFQQVSVQMEEAAQNVGARPSQTLRRITMPLVFANLIAGGILCFSFAMLEVSDSLILAAEENHFPITKAIYILMGRPDGPFIASALGVLGMILLMATLLLVGKFLGKRMGEIFRM